MTETDKNIQKKSGTPSKAKAASSRKNSSAAKKPDQKATSQSAAKKTASAKKTAPVKKVEYQDDLLQVWGELEKEAQFRKSAQRGAASSKPVRTSASRPSGARAAVRPEQMKTAASGANGSSRKRVAENKPAAKRPAAARTSVQTSSPRRPVKQESAVLLVENRNGRDAYDDFLERNERERARKKSSKKKRSKDLGMMLALLTVIGCMLGLAGWQYTQYQTFLMMKAAVDRPTFYEGTMVEGIDVSTMTLEQAIQHWEESVEPKYSQRKVTLSNGAEFSAAELGYSSDYVTVLSNAWGAGRRGSLVERYEALSFRQSQPASYVVNRVAYRDDVIAQCVSAIAEQIDRPAEDSKIESFDMETYEFRFAEAVTGSKLDTEQLAQGMARALDAGGGTVELVVNAIQPKVQTADIAKQYGMITSAVTNASSSSSNRLANIRKALEFIHGTCLKPGETFSFNDTVGKRTTDRGFKMATAYSSGKVVEDVGGGICQVSTTLFNAAVKADLEINERHNHSLTVGYVDKGKDAAVNWRSQDLRFTNNTDDNIYIACYLTGDKRVRFGIFGKLLENGETITVEGVTTGTIDYKTEYQLNMTFAPGQQKVVQKGKKGYKAEAYKIRWDANGNQISRELLCKSTYKATAQIIEYGP